jgi:hypothetical protein
MKKLLLIKMLVATLIVFVPYAQATTITLDFDFEFSGATAPGGSTPWVSATLDDSFGGDNTVRLSLFATNLEPHEFVSEWLFNFDPALDPTSLNFNFISGTQDVINSINTGINDFQADGDGFFDIQFDFPPPIGKSPNKFTAGEFAIFDMTYISPISASSFYFDSVLGGGTGAYKAAAHVQGIGSSDNDSGWVAPSDGNNHVVPEPSTLLLLGLGMIGLVSYRRMKEK